MKRISKLLLCIFICFLAAGLGTLFTTSAIPTWYAQLNKPFFSPPNWVFGPVWSVLYLLMGISLFIIWDSRGAKLQKTKGLQYFFIQLILNASWSIIFFGLKQPTVALIEIIMLWVTIFITIKHFLKISNLAGWLLIPYLLWVTFATLLNLSIVILN